MALRELSVDGIAVVEHARLEPDDAFTVLTGETGAGKSICVNALRAALGGRIDSESLRPGAARACVRAVFDGISDATAARVRELGLPHDELLSLSREVAAGGRAVGRINGALVSQPVLREVGELVAEVTAQGASHRLLQSGRQRQLLDAAGGPELLRLRREAGEAVAAWRATMAALDATRQAARSTEAELADARLTIADLAPLQLSAGEDDDLGTERLRLRESARILSALTSVADAAGGEGSAADILAPTVPGLETASAFDPRLHELLESCADAVARLRELSLDARRAAASVSLDEARLAAVEERLDTLARVTRRHGSLDAALAALHLAQERVAVAEGNDHLDRLEGEAGQARRRAAAAVQDLSEARAAAARRLERWVQHELRHLELPQARFRVRLGRIPDAEGLDLGDGLPVRCRSHGVDDVEFRFASSRDMVPVPLDDGVSGGELARLALALAAVVEGDPLTLVLDEIDSGIGGETAARVGDTLARMGRHRQVIAVTHRAEIAARATTHLLVTKRPGRGVPSATVRRVEGRERTAEVARLLSGRVTRAAAARADELLREGEGQASLAAAGRSVPCDG